MIATAVNGVELAVFIFLFGLVTGAGLRRLALARAPRRSTTSTSGASAAASFGSWITWFLIGGDLYTAYTFVAVPALLFGAGALGFFALPYTIIVYPMVFLVAPRLWSVVAPRTATSRRPTSSAGASARRSLALVIAITGIVATMPYIALQLVGHRGGAQDDGRSTATWPIIIAFGVLAAYTYQSGLRAPALIAFVKDSLIYLVVIVAVIYIPTQLGGWDDIFGAADEKFDRQPRTRTTASCSATRSARLLDARVRLRAGAVPLPALGDRRARGPQPRHDQAQHGRAAGVLARARAARAARLHGDRGRHRADRRPDGRPDPNTIVPLLFDDMFPSWFAGVAFAAIAIGALVPAAIMSIAAANLWTRNIYKEYLQPRRDARRRRRRSASSPRWSSRSARWS